MLVRCLVALLAGLALSLAFEPAGLAALIVPALAVWVLCLRGLPATRAWLPSLLFGAGFQYALLEWQRAVGVDAWLALSALEAAFFAPLGSVVALVSRLPWRPVWIAAAWLGVETIRSGWPESGLPWGRLSFATADTVWQPGLPWLGMSLVSFLLVLTGATLAWVVEEGRAHAGRALLAVGGLVAVTLAPVILPFEVPESGSATVAAVQPDVPGAGNDLVAVHREVTQNLVEATTAYADQVAAGDQPEPDFVLWPENSTAVDPFEDRVTNDAIRAASDALGRPILVGAIVDGPEEGQIRNQGIVWESGGVTDERYTKRHPVPFGEYIPWRDRLQQLGFDTNLGRLRQISNDMVAGDRRTPLSVGGVQVADAICFDVAYDDGIFDQVARGGELVTVQTSNAFYVYTDQLEQQFEISRLRAVETGRTVVVASTNGVSAIVAPDGRVLEQASKQTTAVLAATVPLATRVTPAVRLGLWPGRAAVVVALAAALAGLVRGRRTARYLRRRDGDSAVPDTTRVPGDTVTGEEST